MIRHLLLPALLLSVVACGGGAGFDSTTADPDPAAAGDDGPGATGDLEADPGAGGDPAAGGGRPGGGGGGGAGASGDTESPPGAIKDRPPTVVLPITKADWMSRTPGLADRALNEISIPGSHDSATYGLISLSRNRAASPWRRAPFARQIPGIASHSVLARAISAAGAHRNTSPARYSFLRSLKNGNTSTLDIAAHVRQMLPSTISRLPKDLRVSRLFDQSPSSAPPSTAS